MPKAEKVKLQEITIGNADFTDVIKSGTLFVDKTAKLADLVENNKVFFARPRRLGKTMLLSMLEELFSHGAKDNHYFDGLAVQSLWTDPNCYPVINLTLYGYYDSNTFEHDLCKMLHSAFQRVGFTQVASLDYKNSSLSDLLVDIDRIIADSKIVVLLDEWDYPLLANLDNFKDYEDNLKVLSILFRWLSLLKNVRFVLVTGIGRYENASFFTGQDFVDISMEPLFADLVGYSEYEVKKYFAPHIKAATKLLECSEDELLSKLKQQYGGFCFDKNAEISLYCTWSVNKFFQQIVSYPNTKPNFTNFWMRYASDPKALRNFLAARNVDLTFLDELKSPGVEIKRGDFDVPTSFEQIAIAPLMVQTGYLSISKVVNTDTTDDCSRRYLCYFPNNEVEAVYANVFLNYITNRWSGKGEKWFDATAQMLHDAMYQQDMATVAKCLNLFLTTIPYIAWTKTTEIALHTFIAWTILFGYLYIYTRETIFKPGCSCAEFEFNDNVYNLELKSLPLGGSKHDAVKLADEALAQIMARTSGQNLHPWQQARLKGRYALVLVVAAETRQVCYWRLIELESHQELGSAWVEALPEPEDKDVFKAIISECQSFTSHANNVDINPDDLAASMCVCLKVAKQHGPDAVANKKFMTVVMRAVLRDAQTRPGVKWMTVDQERLFEVLINTVCEMVSVDTHQVGYWRRSELVPSNEPLSAPKLQLESKAVVQEEGGAPSKNAAPCSEPLGDQQNASAHGDSCQQNLQFEIELKSCIGLASKLSRPTKLIAINSKQLVAGLLPLFTTVVQTGIKLDPKWLQCLVLNTITAAAVTQEPNTVKVDPDFLAAQITSRLNDLV